MDECEYEEVTAICSNCGKEVRFIAYKESDYTEYLCPKCSLGDAYFEEDGEF